MGEIKSVSRTWDDGRRQKITVYTDPDYPNFLLIRFTNTWWPQGNRLNTERTSEVVMGIPPKKAEWLAFRIIKWLEKYDFEWDKLLAFEDLFGTPDDGEGPPPDPDPDPDDDDDGEEPMEGTLEEAVEQLHNVLFQPYGVPVTSLFDKVWNAAGLPELGVPDIRGGVVDGGTIAPSVPPADDTALYTAVYSLYYNGLFQARNKSVISYFNAVWAAVSLPEKGIPDISNGRT